MTIRRRSAVYIGILFIIATAMGVLNAGMPGPLIGSDNFLIAVTNNAGLVHLSAFLNAFTAPIALNEVVLAVWLLVKGFLGAAE